jgi:nucleoside-diphosphate-sugar epimerase
MQVLIIGGTGIISVGIVNALLARNANVTILNRGKTKVSIPAGVEVLIADRYDEPALAAAIAGRRFDAVIDMVCSQPAIAEAAVRVFANHCTQYIFCSTVATYGDGVRQLKPPEVTGVLVTEDCAQDPPNDYGRNKLACEVVFLRAHADGVFATTIVRPQITYGPGKLINDQLQWEDPAAWYRIERDLPVLCSGDGVGLTQATHRDDVGLFFAHAVLEPRTYGQAYNVVGDELLTWREFYRQVGVALGRRVQLISMPADWLIEHGGDFCELLGNTRYHHVYSAAKAKQDVPAFRCRINFAEGVTQNMKDGKRRGVWRRSDDPRYQPLVDAAMGIGMKAIEL